MPTSEARDFHVDQLATNMLVGYRPRDFIADQVAPRVPVVKQTGLYAKIDKDAWFRQDDTLRAPRTPAKRGSYTVGSGNYLCVNYAFATEVDWETMANADQPFQPAVQAGMFVNDKLAIDYEIRVENKVRTAAGSSATLTGINAWSDYANSNPLGDIDTGVNAVHDTTGFMPNKAVISRRCWQKLRRHPQLINAVFPGGGGGGTAGLDQLANLIGVDQILIGATIKNTAAEGQTAAFTDVWSTGFALLYVAPAPGIMVPTFMASFLWSNPELGPGLSSPPNFALERKEDDERRCTVFRTGYYQDENIVASELGYYINTGI